MAPQPTHIFHITHIDNLPEIVASGGLIAKSQMQGQDYCNIAHDNIQDRRAYTMVPCGPQGCLHDYTPFYFAPRSPMLFAIKKGNVSGCDADQSEIVYLVSSAQRIDMNNLPYVYTDGHGVMAMTDFYDDLGSLDEVDWDIMNARYWADTVDDPDRKRRRQAEFLVHRFLPWNMIESIVTMNATTGNQVRQIVSNSAYQPPISSIRGWYY
jgi:hypothetical protein